MDSMSATRTREAGESPRPTARSERRIFGLPFAFASFLVVGASAFVVTEATLFLLYGDDGNGLLSFLPMETDLLVVNPDLHLLIASAVAVEVAIAWKFVLYEHWTFADRPRRGNILWRFLQLNAASFLATVVTIATINILTPLLGISPYLSTPIGVLFAFMINWLFSNHFIWREHEHSSDSQASGEI
jgi:putative flippase GtrA